MLGDAEGLLEELSQMVQAGDQLIRAALQRGRTRSSSSKRSCSKPANCWKKTDELLDVEEMGLTPIRLGVDQAMATALVQSLDLMNQRGGLADSWRAVKLAADDLRSVLNLNASQSIRTGEHNRPFDFSLDDSTTRLRLNFDLPLNRKSQRNLYSPRPDQLSSLVATTDGGGGRRQAGRAERPPRSRLDSGPIPDQRDARPPLAAERVESFRLRLALGLPGTSSRLLLDALDELPAAVTTVAGYRIDYIVQRAQLAPGPGTDGAR